MIKRDVVGCDLTKMFELQQRGEHEAHDYIHKLWSILDQIQSYLWNEYHDHDDDTSEQTLDKLLEVCEKVGELTERMYEND